MGKEDRNFGLADIIYSLDIILPPADSTKCHPFFSETLVVQHILDKKGSKGY